MRIIDKKHEPVLSKENLPVPPYLQVEVSQCQHGALLFILKHTGHDLLTWNHNKPRSKVRALCT